MLGRNTIKHRIFSPVGKEDTVPPVIGCGRVANRCSVVVVGGENSIGDVVMKIAVHKGKIVAVADYIDTGVKARYLAVFDGHRGVETIKVDPVACAVARYGVAITVQGASTGSTKTGPGGTYVLR